MRVLWTWSGVAALVARRDRLGPDLLVLHPLPQARRRAAAADQVQPADRDRLLVVPFMIIAGLFYRTVVVEDDVEQAQHANPDVLVQVDAFKWNWQFEYLKSQRHATDLPRQSRPTRQNARRCTHGRVRRRDPGAGDPAWTRRVQIVEHSEDVIHSFWVPEFLFKRDVIPYGTDSRPADDNRFEFTRDDERAATSAGAPSCAARTTRR